MNDNTQPAVLSPNAAPLHCQHRSASGRRFCRMPVSDPSTGLCFRHAAQQKSARDAANVAVRLIGDTVEFTSAVTINRSLGELYKLLAHDEIAPRRAAVMAYTCSLLLRTLPAIQQQEDRDRSRNDEPIIWDFSSEPDTRATESQRHQAAQLAEQTQAPERAAVVSSVEPPK